MPPLSELQRLLREAVVEGESSAVVPLLVGGTNPAGRLAIHRRHYEDSLVSAIGEKFPATTWLIGSTAMHAAASAFVRRHPPTAPCIAEYGENFPRFLAERDELSGLAYLRWFAELEWLLVHAAIAIDRPPLSMQSLADHRDHLVDVQLVGQPGLRYLASPLPVDDLMKLYLMDAAPEQYTLSAAEVWLEICGARGAIRFNRLERGEFLFRQAVASGTSLGSAAERALEADESFDIGAALQRFVMDGLVTEIRSPPDALPR
ncbi:MAG: DNA-binding domain-containing protein [Xanthobacteraceae bacterium]